MSQFENLFKVTKESIELNKPELRAHPLFKNLIGTAKTQMQDMMFIYLMAHPKSMYSHLMGKEKLDRVKKHVQREVEWQPPAQLMAAVGAYEDHIKITPTGKSFLAANKSLYAAGGDINEIVEANNSLKVMLRSRIKALEAGGLGDEESVKMMEECRAILSGVSKNQLEANKIIKALPELIDTVEKIGDNWADEGTGVKSIHGGGTLGNRE